MAPDERASRYNSTPRKVFDKSMDRISARAKRDREDHRADMKALISRIYNLENELELLTEHVRNHCQQLLPEENDFVSHERDMRDS